MKAYLKAGKHDEYQEFQISQWIAQSHIAFEEVLNEIRELDRDGRQEGAKAETGREISMVN